MARWRAIERIIIVGVVTAGGLLYAAIAKANGDGSVTTALWIGSGVGAFVAALRGVPVRGHAQSARNAAASGGLATAGALGLGVLLQVARPSPTNEGSQASASSTASAAPQADSPDGGAVPEQAPRIDRTVPFAAPVTAAEIAALAKPPPLVTAAPPPAMGVAEAGPRLPRFAMLKMAIGVLEPFCTQQVLLSRRRIFGRYCEFELISRPPDDRIEISSRCCDPMITACMQVSLQKYVDTSALPTGELPAFNEPKSFWFSPYSVVMDLPNGYSLRRAVIATTCSEDDDDDEDAGLEVGQPP